MGGRKLTVLLSAAVLAVTRLLAFTYAERFSAGTLKTLTAVSAAAAVCLVICGVWWALSVRRAEKNGKGQTDDG